MGDGVYYAELTPSQFRARVAEAPIAYLPLGTLEWHGEHLPLGSDGLQSQGFFAVLAEKAGGIVLPMLFVGPDLELRTGDRVFYGMDKYGFPEGAPQQLDGSAYWIPEDLFGQVLESILNQLTRAGFRIVVAHGHGPSTGYFRDHAGEWEERFGLKLFHCWREDESDGLGIQTDHAAANETSLMMAVRPELVRLDQLDPSPDVWPTAVSGQDPRTEASAERGRQALSMQADRMAGLLREALQDLHD